jgi:DNA-binding CsgD family transcriptional regulator
MSGFAETVPPAPVRNRSLEARRAARLAKARRERRIVRLLNGGVSVAEIAAREEVTEKRMRALVSEILARRMPEPPAEFLALQVSRLNEALLVAYSAMSGANLKAVDLVW